MPKTGLELPYMRHDYRFSRPKNDLKEPIFTYESQGEKLMFIDQYKNKDLLKENLHFKPRLVYESTELISPFYDNKIENNEYVRKEDLI